ncbi:MAG: TlpA family protein disulfide reductase [Bacteroidales bacterium]|nr:TlpA family protein disulfide reductase [Bacteroidales bacterium]
MKKYFLMAALLLAALACKGTRPLSERVAEYNDRVDAVVNTYKAGIVALQEEEGLEPELVAQRQEDLYDAAVEGLLTVGRETIEANMNDSLAVIALQDVAGYMAPEEVLGYVEKMDSSWCNAEPVASLAAEARAKLATAPGAMFVDFAVVEDPAKGDTVRLSDFVGKGKYILADFWASWCGPCKREIPNIKSVYEKYKGKDFDVLSIAVWDKPEDTAAAAKEHGVVWSQIVNTDRVATDAYGIKGIPHIILFGPDGVIVARDLRGEEIEKAVAKALGK